MVMSDYTMWLLARLIAFTVIVFSMGCSGSDSHNTSSLWYPFDLNLSGEKYSTGPFAMTSNIREDNPIWDEMAAFNKAQARLTYAMSRGTNSAEIAWLFPQAEWVDAPALRLDNNFFPNTYESDISKELKNTGFMNDRISRSDLENAVVNDNQVVVGAMGYDAVLIDNLEIAKPELLANLFSLAQQGIPVFVMDGLPDRAAGWADHEARDAAVQTH